MILRPDFTPKAHPMDRVRTETMITLAPFAERRKAMGYFKDYENTPCYRCGDSNCSGNCAAEGKPVDREPTVTHFEQGFGHSSCDCHVCQNMRTRIANRRTRE